MRTKIVKETYLRRIPSLGIHAGRATKCVKLKWNACSAHISSLPGQRIDGKNSGSGGIIKATTLRWGAGGAVAILTIPASVGKGQSQPSRLRRSCPPRNKRRFCHHDMSAVSAGPHIGSALFLRHPPTSPGIATGPGRRLFVRRARHGLRARSQSHGRRT